MRESPVRCGRLGGSVETRNHVVCLIMLYLLSLLIISSQNQCMNLCMTIESIHLLPEVTRNNYIILC